MLKERGPGDPAATLDDCAGCGGAIHDRYYLSALDRLWHDHCLRCSECHTPMDMSCYARDGHIFCKDDYFRLFCLKNCARCGTGIPANELVMKALDMVFHISCFLCVACGTLLSKGDVYGLKDGMVYCRLHYESVCLDDFCDDDVNNVHRCQQDQSSENGSPQYYTQGPSSKGRPRKRRPQGSSDDLQTSSMRIAGSNGLDMLHRDLSSSMESLTFDSSVTSPGSVSNHSQRTKRMRTSFKHHQLRTMKSYFAINQNPDAKDLKQLAQKTGLSKRVLQVWFQNARAKWRRNIMRQETNQLGVNGVNSPGMNGPGINGPVINGPVLNGPSMNDPVLNGPIMNGPITNGPIMNGPGMNGPGMNAPGMQPRSGLMMGESLQQVDNLRDHNPMQHVLAFNEMF